MAVREQKETVKIPGTMAIMTVYLVVFMLSYIAMFVLLGSKWPIG